MWSAVDQYVRKHGIIEEGDRLVLGLSGGADSVCLARYLLYLKKRIGIDFEAVHVNHKLRGDESERDAAFVADFCTCFQIPLTVFDIDVLSEAKSMRCSVEEAGRLIRYRFFRQVAGERGCGKIAVAHHRKDQVETVLLHQVRGTGFRGLSGMRPVRGDIVRPLLSTGRGEILAILAELGQDFREDSTNQSLDYQRNCVRHRILPALEDLNPRAEEHIFGLADRMADLEDFLTPHMDALYRQMVRELPGDLAMEDGNVCQDDVSRDRERRPGSVFVHRKIKDKSRFEIMEVIRRAVSALKGSGKDLGAVHYEIVEELLYNKAGKRNHLPDGIRAAALEEGIVLFREGMDEGTDRSRDMEAWEEEVPQLPDLKQPCIHWKGEMLEADLYYVQGNKRTGIKTDCEICIDYDKIKDKLTFRYRKPGDYFICDSLGHRKLLKRYFIDSKIPAGERGSCLLLAEGSHVLWMQTGRVSEECRVSENTKSMLLVNLQSGE